MSAMKSAVEMDDKDLNLEAGPAIAYEKCSLM